MKRGMLVLAVAMGSIALAGCGSSGSGSTTETTTVTVGGRTTTAVVTNGGKTTSKPGSGGLHAATTPKFGAPPANAPVQSGTVQIAYRNIAIDPDVLKVKVGSTIRWTNYDPVEHNVTSKGGPSSFSSKDFSEGKTFEFKVTKAGVIHYECTIHPTTMNGTIEVVN
jgi:plastocyanin